MHPTDWQRAILLATYLFIAVVVVGVMYWAQAVLIPVALAMLLTLMLAPLVAMVERLRVGRAAAVVLVVALASCMLAGMGWVFTRQFMQMADQLPNYTETIRAKVRTLRDLATGPATGGIGKLVSDIGSELSNPLPLQHDEQPADESSTAANADDTPAAAADESSPAAPTQRPEPERGDESTVVVQSESPTWVGRLTAALGTVGELLATFALAVVLAIFMLINRERLRDRVIRLIGYDRLTATTKAFDDAVSRISRFLLMQLVVNGTYGLALSLGLWVIGVPYALLWGLLAALLRYIPYLGAWIAATAPVLTSFVMSDGWSQPLIVIGWITVIELISNNVVEPLLYGHSMGVSAVALMVAAAFWAFLWGPIGLVLSSPLTVCLVVLGKYVPQLEFIDILLGDKSALRPHERLYQRLLARDEHEVLQITNETMNKHPANEVFDALVVPALCYFKRDLEHGELTDDDEQHILRGVRHVVESLAGKVLPLSTEPVESEQPVEPRVTLLACPASGDADQLAIEMLAHLLDARHWDVRVVGDDLLAAELVESVEREHAPVVCIGSMPPGGLAHARYMCKRLRSFRSDVRILVGRWGTRDNSPSSKEQLTAAGADAVQWTLLDTCRQLNSWRPMLAERAAELLATANQPDAARPDGSPSSAPA